MSDKYLASSEFLTQRYLDFIFQGGYLPLHPASDHAHTIHAEPDIGAHIYSQRLGGAYTHHGIYVGENEVVHYSGFCDGIRATSGPVNKISLDDFQRENKKPRGFSIQKHPNATFEPEQIVENALMRFERRENKYNLLSNNCEHFAYQCIYDESKSEQVERFKKFAQVAAARAFGKVSPATHFAVASQEVVKAFKDYLSGDIDGNELANRVSDTAIRSSSVGFYGMLGQATIPIPAVGFVIGCGVGFVLGNLMVSSGILSLGESDNVKFARERYEAVKSFCNTAKAQAKASRRQLEEYMSTYFSERREAIGLALNKVEQAVVNGDTEQFTEGLEQLNSRIGQNLRIKSFIEFDAMMESDEVFRF